MTDMDKILPAIAKAIGEVKKLGKDNKNTEQKYSFASIDDFLAMVNPICAENGLVVLMQEDELTEFTRAGKYGDTFWIRMRFQISVYHTSGQMLPPVSRSVEVIRTGAQTYGSAQSYVLKQFLRGLLLIPTGDADDADQNGYGKGAPAKPGNPMAGAIDQTWRDSVMDNLPENASPRQIAEAFAEAICADFVGKGEDALKNRWDRHRKMIEKMELEHPDLHEKVVDAFESRMIELQDKAKAA